MNIHKEVLAGIPVEAPAHPLQADLLRFRPQIEAALAYSNEGHTFDSLMNEVMLGALYFAFNDTSCALLERVMGPLDVRVHVVLGAGTLQGLLQLYDVIAPKVKALGATKMTILGRPGFEKALKQQGWVTPKVYMERVL